MVIYHNRYETCESNPQDVLIFESQQDKKSFVSSTKGCPIRFCLYSNEGQHSLILLSEVVGSYASVNNNLEILQGGKRSKPYQGIWLPQNQRKPHDSFHVTTCEVFKVEFG